MPNTKNIPTLIIFLAVLVSIRFWSFQGFSYGFYDNLDLLVCMALLLMCLFNIEKIKQIKSVFKINVVLLIVLPIISCIGAIIYHRQSVFDSMLAVRVVLYWLVYFVLHLYEVPPKKVISFLIFIGIVWMLITIAQQFTYPSFWFYTRDDQNDTLFRAGVYRFMVNGFNYGFFVLFFFYFGFLQKRKLSFFMLVLLGLVSFYYFGTRQFIPAIAICMVIITFINSKYSTLYSLLVIILLGIFITIYQNVLFREYVEMTNEEVKSEDNIRYLSGYFFLVEYWPHWTAWFIGNGAPHASSSYGQEIVYYKEYLGFYRSDVGIIGAFNMFGLLYVINIIWLNVKGLKSKYYEEDNQYLKLFFYSSLILLILSEFYANPVGIPFYCIIFYLVDKSYKEKSNDE